jgi:hypothetical protein
MLIPINDFDEQPAGFLKEFASEDRIYFSVRRFR